MSTIENYPIGIEYIKINHNCKIYNFYKICHILNGNLNSEIYNLKFYYYVLLKYNHLKIIDVYFFIGEQSENYLLWNIVRN